MAADLFALMMHWTENSINVTHDLEAFGQNYSHFLKLSGDFQSSLWKINQWPIDIDLKTFKLV